MKRTFKGQDYSKHFAKMLKNSQVAPAEQDVPVKNDKLTKNHMAIYNELLQILRTVETPKKTRKNTTFKPKTKKKSPSKDISTKFLHFCRQRNLPISTVSSPALEPSESSFEISSISSINEDSSLSSIEFAKVEQDLKPSPSDPPISHIEEDYTSSDESVESGREGIRKYVCSAFTESFFAQMDKSKGRTAKLPYPKGNTYPFHLILGTGELIIDAVSEILEMIDLEGLEYDQVVEIILSKLHHVPFSIVSTLTELQTRFEEIIPKARSEYVDTLLRGA